MATISLSALLLSVLPCLAVAWIAQAWTGRGREVMVAVGRMLVQLLGIGFALVFIFGSTSLWVGTGVVLVMISVSAFISVRLIDRDRPRALGCAFVALGVSGCIVLAYTLLAVLRTQDEGYQPRVLIPIAGMVFSNAMTAITLAAERLQRELAQHADHRSARGAAWTAALIPQINALLAVGLVALPGMMTGQILAGVDPLVAVRYQIVILAMILQASSLAVAIFLWLYRPGPTVAHNGSHALHRDRARLE